MELTATRHDRCVHPQRATYVKKIKSSLGNPAQGPPHIYCLYLRTVCLHASEERHKHNERLASVHPGMMLLNLSLVTSFHLQIEKGNSGQGRFNSPNGCFKCSFPSWAAASIEGSRKTLNDTLMKMQSGVIPMIKKKNQRKVAASGATQRTTLRV